MSFIPKEEYVPRRGVAMKIVEPNPNLRTGVPRDIVLEKEATKFQHKDFILNRAMTDNYEKQSKVRTFKSNAIPWATGNGNVLAPPKPEPKEYRRVIGQRVPDDQLAHFYHGEAIARERRNQQMLMEEARNFADNFSPQKPERMHKILPRALEENSIHQVRNLSPINGFRGLGSVCRDRAAGKAHVPESTFDPLGMRSWGPRITGLKRLPQSSTVTLAEEALAYNDNIPFEANVKVKRFGNPHKVQFPVNYGPDQDMHGFRGLGESDVPNPTHGRRHSPRQFQDHDYRASERNRTNSGAPTPTTQYRSASSLGMQDPRGMMSKPGNTSAPPGGSSLMYHPARN